MANKIRVLLKMGRHIPRTGHVHHKRTTVIDDDDDDDDDDYDETFCWERTSSILIFETLS
jgi:hypothetical protein